MIPLKDDVPSERIPFITLGLIGLNVLVFLYQASIRMGGDPRAAEAVAFEFGATPCRITGACPVPGDFPSPVATIFTSMFLHGGLLHVGGNMLYLWIFDDNVEDTLGHGRYLTLYMLAGVAAASTQVAVHPRSPVPMISASGAVSGVLGAYILLFPFAGVHVLLVFRIPREGRPLAGAGRTRVLDRHPGPQRNSHVQLGGVGRWAGRGHGVVCPHRRICGGRGPAVSDAAPASRSPIMSA